jgi:glycerol-1-phosphate dehydrogenase [NAD(P)+]
MTDRFRDTRTASALDYGFPTVFGRNLVEELNSFVHRPFLVVTMEDLWPKFERQFDARICRPYIVRSVEEQVLEKDAAVLRDCEAIVGLGGGQAIDAAKFLAWKRRLPLFQVPTALSVNAVYGQRSGVRIDGRVRYVGWAVPESVFIDYDIILSAPAHMNYSGIGDILCFHTGVLDWQYATKVGKCEVKWPFDSTLADQSLAKVQNVLDHRDDIRNLTEVGIHVLVDGLKWGTSYHGAGWNPRHIEGIDHFVFYALERLTGRKFLHGQPVCLGVYVGCLLHDARAEEMLEVIHDIGLDIRPEAMGLTWDDVTQALCGIRRFVQEAGLWHSIAHDVDIDPPFVNRVRSEIEALYGRWPA